MDEWLNFYREYFPSEDGLLEFVQSCEQLNPGDENHRAKIMMHQGKRLLCIAKSIECVEEGREPLKLLFLLIAAENMSKLHIPTVEEGRSRYHTKRFFESFCIDEDKEKILSGIEIDGQSSNLTQIIDVLYDIRCNVVHEGTYWGFDFATTKTPYVLTGINVGQVLRVKLKYQEFHDIVARGIVCATQKIIRT